MDHLVRQIRSLMGMEPETASNRPATVRLGNSPIAIIPCGARNRRGTPCQSPGMANGRCRLHGGLSTGPKTPEGLRRSQMARWKSGDYSRNARLHRSYICEVGRLISIAQGPRNYRALHASLDRLDAILSDPAYEGY